MQFVIKGDRISVNGTADTQSGFSSVTIKIFILKKSFDRA